MQFGQRLTQHAFYQCDQCGSMHDLNWAQGQARKKGIAFAYCGSVIFQVLKCSNPQCSGNFVYRCDPGNPIIDMQRLVLAPNQNPIINRYEQCCLLENNKKLLELLGFSLIPAWDTTKISEEQFIDHFSWNLAKSTLTATEVSLFMTESDFYDRLKEEAASGKVRLRRALPDTPIFRSLLTCLAPNKIREISDDGYSFADGNAPEDLVNRRNAWKNIIEAVAGQKLETAITEKLKSKGLEPPSPSDLGDLVTRELLYKVSPSQEQLWDIFYEKGFDEQLDSFFLKVFRSIFYPVCTELALRPKRKELLSWPTQVEQGKALFVDAPMGLGKTYSIVEALASNPDLSAVVFMPTNHLCREITERLKYRIAPTKGIGYFEMEGRRKPVLDDDGNNVLDEDGLFQCEFDKDFLKDEVYYADGINPTECPYYNRFIERYKFGLYTKIDICNSCEKYSIHNGEVEIVTCRFRRHYLDAPNSRIVVTTHRQYANYSKLSEIKKWYKQGKYKRDENGRVIKKADNKLLKKKSVPRSLFIVDEDIVLSLCYQPISLRKQELTAFVATVTDFMADSENLNGQPIPNESIGKIRQILGLFDTCGTTAVVPPIDPNFKFPKQIANAWNQAFNKQEISRPETLGDSEPVGNHLQIIEKALQVGFVVQNYPVTIQKPGNEENRRIKKAFFSNPVSHDLKDLPSHVFFDGTMLDNKFLNEKLRNVKFNKIKIDVEPLWQIRVKQNIWTDLPKSQISQDRGKIEHLLHMLINGLGCQFKYFIVTKKDIREAYLDQFLEANFHGLNYVINHYGNLRGENKAKDCDVGIMLGSYAPSDAVEIAMALDFIQNRLAPNRPIQTKDNLWAFEDTNFRRIYKDDFSIIGEMADAYRLSEHRQAIARIRYLFHDVDFYIVSKDLVSSYDPFLPEPSDTQFRADLFPPRPIRPEAQQKFDEVMEKVFEWLQTSDTVNATDIYNRYGIRRQTVGVKLKEMETKGFLEKATKTKYRLPILS